MIPNCMGCIEELKIALYEQENNGLYMATDIDFEMSFPFCKGHFCLLMVNDKGELVIQ